MKKIFTLAIAGLLAVNFSVRAQDAALMEQAQKLIGKVADLSETVELQQKKINLLETELRAVREEQNKPRPDAVSREELRDLVGKVREMDEKRAADKELILKEISKLASAPVVMPTTNVKPHPKPKPVADETLTDTKPAPPAANYEGFEHTVKSGETLLAIIKAYNKEQGLKNTLASVLKHPLNAKVKERVLVGQKVFIPASAK
ncbi:MAG: hypothetical protein RL380_993 [Verrucomicrobiota bacterium]|jgi:uncharacterized coiled-coil protein SlyX